jgi:hypothetical protein
MSFATAVYDRTTCTSPEPLYVEGKAFRVVNQRGRGNDVMKMWSPFRQVAHYSRDNRHLCYEADTDGLARPFPSHDPAISCHYHPRPTSTVNGYKHKQVPREVR